MNRGAWNLGEKLIDDDVSRIDVLGDQFPDGVPRLRTTDKLLMLRPGDEDGITFFENTRRNRRELIRQILDQLPEGGADPEGCSEEDDDEIYTDPEPDYDEDFGRPVEAEKKSQYRYAS